jgi:hypothetical protein
VDLDSSYLAVALRLKECLRSLPWKTEKGKEEDWFLVFGLGLLVLALCFISKST